MQHRKKVLLTGANGLLGSNVANQLFHSGYTAITIIRKNSNRLALKGVHCEIIEGDITLISDLENAIKGCEYVVHCAANTDQKGNDLEAHRLINITATSNLIVLSKKYDVKLFVFVSTANCFTNGTLENPGNESEGFMPWLRGSGYAHSKYIAQEIVLDEVKKNGFPAIVVAPTFVIGSRDAKISSGKLIMHVINKKIVFYPPGGKSIVDADFAAEAIVNSIETAKIGESYLLSGENLSYKKLFKKISNYSNRKSLHIPIPLWFLKLVSKISSFLENVFNLSLPLNKTNQQLLCLDNYFSNKKAIKFLKLKDTDSDKAIEKSIKWYQENGYL